jgi:hypothetical protein
MTVEEVQAGMAREFVKGIYDKAPRLPNSFRNGNFQTTMRANARKIPPIKANGRARTLSFLRKIPVANG